MKIFVEKFKEKYKYYKDYLKKFHTKKFHTDRWLPFLWHLNERLETASDNTKHDLLVKELTRAFDEATTFAFTNKEKVLMSTNLSALKEEISNLPLKAQLAEYLGKIYGIVYASVEYGITSKYFRGVQTQAISRYILSRIKYISNQLKKMGINIPDKFLRKRLDKIMRKNTGKLDENQRALIMQIVQAFT